MVLKVPVVLNGAGRLLKHPASNKQLAATDLQVFQLQYPGAFISSRSLNKIATQL